MNYIDLDDNAVKKRSGGFKLSPGSIIKDEKRDLFIICGEYIEKEQKPDKKGRIYISKEKYYKYICRRCGWTGGYARESALISQGAGCPCCSGKITVCGINTLWDVARWICDLGVSEEDAKKCTKGTNKKVEVTCPCCRNKKMAIISDIYKNKSIGCTCGDGFSYGSKYLYSLLKQLDVDFKDEIKFEWCEFYNSYKGRLYKGIYDFVIESMKIIIEVDGDFHRRDNNMTGQTKDESEFIDREKDRLAKENGYRIIRIFYDSLNVEIEKYIYASELKEIFNLTLVNTSQCEKFALNNNRIKDVCEYWSNKRNYETTADLASVFNTSSTTIRKYLRKGTKIWEWCNYDSESEAKKMRVKNTDANKLNLTKKVEVIKDGVSLGIFKSLSELSNVSQNIFGVKLQISKISMVCQNKRPHHQGFTFKYID